MKLKHLIYLLLLSQFSRAQNIGIGTTQPQSPLDVKAASAGPLIMLENTTPMAETALRLRSNWPSDGSSNTTITLGLQESKFNIYASVPQYPQYKISLLTLAPVQPDSYAGGIRTGINTFNPQAPLHVRGSATSTIASNITFFNAEAAGINGIRSTPNWTGTVVGYFEGNVVSTISFIAAANNIFSDKRIKDIIGQSNGAEDLEKLRRIAITRYRYKDKWQMGDAVHTKVIAQQVKEVFPEAVSQIRNYVADVLKEAQVLQRQNNTTTIELMGGATLKPGVRIKCFTPTGSEIYATVLSVQGNNCTLDQAVEADRLFVYGTEVPDFHVVDYDAISMLNVSATQELLRRIEALEKELEALKKK